MSGRVETKLARGRRVQKPCLKYALLYQRLAAVPDAFSIKRLRAETSPAMRVVNDRYLRRKYGFAQMVF
jgi:hypothetical protein